MIHGVTVGMETFLIQEVLNIHQMLLMMMVLQHLLLLVIVVQQVVWMIQHVTTIWMQHLMMEHVLIQLLDLTVTVLVYLVLHTMQQQVVDHGMERFHGTLLMLMVLQLLKVLQEQRLHVLIWTHVILLICSIHLEMDGMVVLQMLQVNHLVYQLVQQEPLYQEYVLLYVITQKQQYRLVVLMKVVTLDLLLLMHQVLQL